LLYSELIESYKVKIILKCVDVLLDRLVKSGTFAPMQKSEVQCVYWSHGRFDSDLQDRMFDEVMPEFFTDGDPSTRNLLGIESAGTFTDQERDDYLGRVGRSPVNGLITGQVNGVQDEVEAKVAVLVTVLTNMGNGCLLSRETILLGKWNTENPQRMVFPYHESYPTEVIKDEIGQRSDDLLSVLSLRKDKRIFWRSLVDIARGKSEGMMKFVAERNENWLRMLSDLTLKAEQSRTRFKILVTLGRLHFQLTEELKRELSDKLVIHDDIVLPDSNSYGLYGGDRLMDRQLRGESMSDEDYLRVIFFEAIKSMPLYGQNNDRSGFYAVDRAELAKIWECCANMSVEEIASLLGLIVDKSKCTEYVPVDDVVTGSTSHDEYLANISCSVDCSSFLVDRRNHPNNLYIDRQCVLSLLCHVIGIKGSDWDVICLLKQVVDKIQSPDLLYILRRESCEFALNGDHRIPVGLSAVLHTIANASMEERATLWTDTSKKGSAGGRLVGLAKKLFPRPQ